MNPNIQLELINQAQGTAGNEVLVFQRDPAHPGTTVVAWKVIRHLKEGHRRRLVYPLAFELSAADDRGHETARVAVKDGQAFDVRRQGSALTMVGASQPAPSPKEVTARNDLTEGAITVRFYRDGRLLASTAGVAPDQTVAFEFLPRIFLAVVPAGNEEGAPIEPDSLDATELDLSGISSADIIWSGRDGSYIFTLSNVKR